MRKTNLVFPCLILVSLIAAACQANPTSGAEATSLILNENYPDAAGLESQLALGTLQLDATELAVSEEQAAGLIPFWKLLRNLENQDSTAAQEIAAVLEKIESLMTVDQLDRIAGMRITQSEVVAVRSGEVNANDSGPAAQSNDNFAGGPPADAMGGLPQNQGIFETPSGGSGSAGPSSSTLLDALINLLQVKIQATL